MQETEGPCCEKCHIYLDYKDSHQCSDGDCPCHNSSDAFIEEALRDPRVDKLFRSAISEAEKSGANEFRQKVLEVFKGYLGANNEKLLTVSDAYSIISNLEV